jgi:predicted DNA-binding transcriptional regulator AlpA
LPTHDETITELEPLLSTPDVARITGRSVSTLEKDRIFGTGPAFVKIGKSVKYHPRDVREWLQGFQTVRSTTEARAGQ